MKEFLKTDREGLPPSVKATHNTILQALNIVDLETEILKFLEIGLKLEHLQLTANIILEKDRTKLSAKDQRKIKDILQDLAEINKLIEATRPGESSSKDKELFLSNSQWAGLPGLALPEETHEDTSTAWVIVNLP